MSRQLRLTLAAVTLTLLVGGCIPSTNPSSGGEDQGKADGEITWFYPGGEQPESKVVWQDQVKRFEKSHPAITVTVLPVPWELAHDRLVNMIRAGDAPDVIQIGSRWLNEFSSMGALEPLDKHFGSSKEQIFYPSFLETAKNQGTLYTLPRQASTQALIYRKDLIESPPKTWDELISTARRVQQQNPGMKGFALSGATHVSTVSQFLTILPTYGGTVFDEHGQVTLDSDATVATLRLMQDLHRKHELMPNPLQYNREQFGELFKAGQIAMFISGPWGGATVHENPDNPKTPYASSPVPAGPAGTGTEVVTDSIGVSATTPDKKAAITFLDWLTTEQEFVRKDVMAKNLPEGPGIAADPQIKQDEYLQTFLDMSRQGNQLSQPAPQLWEPFETVMTDMVQSVLIGEATPEDAAKLAAQTIESEDLAPAAK